MLEIGRASNRMVRRRDARCKGRLGAGLNSVSIKFSSFDDGEGLTAIFVRHVYRSNLEAGSSRLEARADQKIERRGAGGRRLRIGWGRPKEPVDPSVAFGSLRVKRVVDGMLSGSRISLDSR